MMEALLSLLADILSEGILAVASNKRTSKPVRYALLAVWTLFFTAVAALLLALGIALFGRNRLASAPIFLLALCILSGGIRRCVKAFRK